MPGAADQKRGGAGKRSRVAAGLLMYRSRDDQLQVLLAHPGGPYFRKKDQGAWTIPKGEVKGDESLLETARREFQEETGITPAGKMLHLGEIRQKGGKLVHAWAFEGDLKDGQAIVSNTVKVEWPPRSGTWQDFPEVDRAEFFDIEAAKAKIKDAQIPLIDRLAEHWRSSK